MSHTKKKAKTWYDLDVVVEVLIHETPRGERYAPEIGNLCVGFTELSSEQLEKELNELRECWPIVFPKDLKTENLLNLIEKKYPAYEEIMTLRERV